MKYSFHVKGLQIGVEITNRGKTDFKSGQGLQIGAEQQPSLSVA